MKTVSFISIEDDPPDLILSFAIWEPELDDIRSLILLRTPKYEVFLNEYERGVKVTDDAWLNDEDEMAPSGISIKPMNSTFYEFININKSQYSVSTPYAKFSKLHLSPKKEIEQAKKLIERMNFDNRFEIRSG